MKKVSIIQKYALLCAVLLIPVLAMVSCTNSPDAPLEANTGEAVNHTLEVDLLGTISTFPLGSNGRLKTAATAISADGTLSIFIGKDTALLDENKEPLQSILVEIDPTLPLPPEDAYLIGQVYDLIPKGATFSSPLKLTISYDRDELLPGVSESDAYIACYENGGWEALRYKQLDTEKHNITTQINRLAKYAVLIPQPKAQNASEPAPEPISEQDLTSISLEQVLTNGKPTLAEFGWRNCIPCKAMKPILEELAVDYADTLNVAIIEIYDHMDLTREYQIMAMPTQVLFDSNGKEITRHIGFWSKEEILVQLKDVGIS